MTSRAYCRCPASVGSEVVDGGLLLCSECGNVRPDPLILAVFREQRRISRQQTAMLEAIERLERRGGDPVDEQYPEEIPVSPKKLLGPAELARQLGKSAQWARENFELLGGFRVGKGPRPRYLFDPVQARERLAARSNGAGRSDTKPKPKPPRRRRQRPVDAPLLEVKQ